VLTDAITGLPNRELLFDRIGQGVGPHAAMARRRGAGPRYRRASADQLHARTQRVKSSSKPQPVGCEGS
jgi:hypothetical protein